MSAIPRRLRLPSQSVRWLAAATHSQLWVRWLGPAMVLGWLGLALHLGLRRHATFQTHIFDLGYYTQVLWYTAHGQWFFTNLRGFNFLQDHFSPLLAVLAPLLRLVPDPRPLIVVQVVVLAAPILPAYAILRARHARLAPWLVLAYCLNFLVHRTALLEFHEIMLAAPFLAVAGWALYFQRRWLVVVSLGLTLLVREDMGLYVAVFGLYACCVQPGARRFGLALIAAGAAWTGLVPTVLMPALGFGVSYHLGRLIGGAGSAASLPETVMRAVAGLFTWPKLRALGQVLAAVGGLPLLGAGEQLLWLFPALFLLVLPLSEVGGLRDWYVAPLLPMLWCGMALALARMPSHTAGRWLGVLLLGTGLTFAALSPFPGGAHFRSDAYRFTRHHQIGHEVLGRLPPVVPVIAQSALGPHVAARSRVEVFPWYELGTEPKWIVLDVNGTATYPLGSVELLTAVKNLKLDPTLELAWEQDGYHLFHTHAGWSPPAEPLGVWSGPLALETVALAQTDTDGAFQPSPAALTPGRTLRVGLYWTAQMPLPANYSISVLVMAPDGFMLAQDDAWPGQGLMGTLALVPGETIRDFHYIALPNALPAEVTISVVVYDADTQVRLAPESGYVVSTLPANANP